MIWRKRISAHWDSIERAKKSKRDLSNYPWHSLYSNPPKNLPSDLAMVRHYDAVSADRPSSFGGVGRIPWSSINEYAKEHGYEGSFRKRFVEILQIADLRLVGHCNSEESKKDDRKSKEEKKRKDRLRSKVDSYRERIAEMTEKENQENGSNG